MAVIVLNSASGGLLPTPTPSKTQHHQLPSTSYKPPVFLTSTSGAWSCRNDYNNQSSCIQTSSTDKSSTWSSSLATSSSSSSRPLPYYHPNDPRRTGNRMKLLQRQRYDREAEKKLYGGPSFSVPSPDTASLPLPSFGPSFSVPSPAPASLPLPSFLSTVRHTPQQQQEAATTTATTMATEAANGGRQRRQYSRELLLSLSQSAAATCPIDELALRDLVD